MSDYRRWFVPGGTFFFTVVTFNRRPIFDQAESRRLFKAAVDGVRQRWPFDSIAYVMLYDHIHVVWQLPAGDSHYPARWKRIKEDFTRAFLASGGQDGWRNESRRSRGERAVWQRRYLEHVVQDEDDLKRCVDYIHYNPKKHGYVDAVKDWPWSSFSRFVTEGEYGLTWGCSDPLPGYDAPEWGDA